MAARSLLATTAILLLLTNGCGQAPQMPQQPPIVVTVSKPAEIEVLDNYYFEGYTDAVETVDVRSRVNGYLSQIFFQDGSDVKKGDKLFQIDPRPYQAELDQAQAALARAEAVLKRYEADLARAQRLLGSKTITQEEYDLAVANRNEAIADVRARQAAVQNAQLNLQFAAIEAPIAGRISRTLVTVGNLVTANQTHLTTIVSVNPIYAYFDVDEPTVLRIQQMIREGKLESAREAKIPVYLALDIDTDYPYQGTIDFVEPRINPSTGTLKVRAVFPNDNRALSPGLHARIKLPRGKPYQALAVSDRAIQSSQGQKFVYVINKDNQVAARPVTLGSLHDGMRVVTEGLTADERVIVSGTQRVRPGVIVEPRTAESAAPPPAGAAAAAPAKQDPS